MKNALSWFEIPAADIERARRFYEAIFAFEMRPLDLGELKMMMFPAQGGVGGALCQYAKWYAPAGDAGPLIYLEAEPDLADVLARVESAGGAIVIPKRQVSPQFGYMAVFRDSEGNRVALHSMK